MATEEAEHTPADETGTSVGAAESGNASETGTSNARVGSYSWADFMEEYGYGDEIDILYPHGTSGPDDQLGLDPDESARTTAPTGADWERVEFDPTPFLGYHPDELPELIGDVFKPNAEFLHDIFRKYVDPETTPVIKGFYTWEHYKWEFYYDDDGSRPRDSAGEIEPFDREAALGFDPESIADRLTAGTNAAMELDDVIEDRTVNVNEDLDEDKFFSTAAGGTTVTNRYDLEKAVPMEKKLHFNEVERYWVNKPYSFVIIFHSEKENEKKYYAVEPYFNEIEEDIQKFLGGKLRTAIKYSDDGIKHTADEEGRREVIEEETRRLLKRYDLFDKRSGKTEKGLIETLRTLLEDDDEHADTGTYQLEGLKTRPEPAILADDPDTLTEYQVEKLLYVLKRNFLGYELIDPIKHDINVEDISCDGYNSPVFVYHSGYEQIISNIYHGKEELDDFVIKLAQRSGKGISKRLPQVDTTLPDGSRAQLTLGEEVSDHGTNYTIRQFKDVPFTPIDLINWNTFSLDEMAFLWLAIENHKSLIFAGGTASGKTTSLNAVSLFIPSNTKIVSIEDTREVELPQRNWIASVTRPSFSDDDQGDVDEFDLLEAALRQRPDYIVMGEIRGEEGRTLFQVMSTGHTTYTTFHADSVDEVLKRFTTDPINVSKTMFTALDLVSIQTQTRVQGQKVRRNKSLTEINHYEAEHDEINVQDVYQWQAETDEYLKMGESNTLEEIKFDRGWSDEKLEEELFKRQLILAYLIKNDLNTYAEVAATVQAFINDPDTILTLVANDRLEQSLTDLREMESVLIDVDPEKEALVPRPDSTSETYNLSTDILERAEESLFDEYRGKVPTGLASALGDVETADPIEVDRADADEFDFGGNVDDTIGGDALDFGDSSGEFGFDTADTPAWLDDDGGFEIGDEASADATGGGTTAEDSTGETPAPAPASKPGTDADAAEPDQPPALEDGSASAESAVGHVADDGSPESTRPESDGVEPTKALSEDVGAAESTTETNRTASSSEDGGLFDGPATVEGGDEAESSTETNTGSDGETDEFVGLFSDMGSTLDDLEATSDVTEEQPTTADDENTGPDTSDFDTMFPDRDLDTIFGSGPPTDETADEEPRPPSQDAAEPLELDFGEDDTAEPSASDTPHDSPEESDAVTEEGEQREDTDADPGAGETGQTERTDVPEESDSIFSEPETSAVDETQTSDPGSETPVDEPESIFSDTDPVFDEDSGPDETDEAGSEHSIFSSDDDSIFSDDGDEDGKDPKTESESESDNDDDLSEDGTDEERET